MSPREMTPGIGGGLIHPLTLEFDEEVPSVVVFDEQRKRLLHHGRSRLRVLMLVIEQMQCLLVAGDIRDSGRDDGLEQFALFSRFDPLFSNLIYENRDLLGVLSSLLEQRWNLARVADQKCFHGDSTI